MTEEEKRNALERYCMGRKCNDCIIGKTDPSHKCGNGFWFTGEELLVPFDEIIIYYDLVFGATKPGSVDDRDQKVKADAGKPRPTLVPTRIIWEIAKIREYGCRKYPEGGTDNWKQVEPERYFDALVRHILAAWDDYDSIDPESGLMHLSHAACNLAFLLQLMEEKHES